MGFSARLLPEGGALFKNLIKSCMKKAIVFGLSLFFVASPVFAAFTQPQIDSIISLLRAFSVDEPTVLHVQDLLNGDVGQNTASTSLAITTTTPVEPINVQMPISSSPSFGLTIGNPAVLVTDPVQIQQTQIAETYPETNSVVNLNKIYTSSSAASALDPSNDIGSFVLQNGNKEGLMFFAIKLSSDANSATIVFKSESQAGDAKVASRTFAGSNHHLDDVLSTPYWGGDLAASSSMKIGIAIDDRQYLTPGTYSVRIHNFENASNPEGKPVEISGFPLTFTFQIQ